MWYANHDNNKLRQTDMDYGRKVMAIGHIQALDTIISILIP